MEGSDEFAQKVITLTSGLFFDQPPAARTLLGVVETLNRLAAEESSSVFLENSENQLFYALNCVDDEIKKSTYRKDKLEFSASKNLINALLPFRAELLFKQLVELIFKE
jgi:hypothetical protein